MRQIVQAGDFKYTSDNTDVTFIDVLWTNFTDSRLYFENSTCIFSSLLQAFKLVQYCNKNTYHVMIILVTLITVMFVFFAGFFLPL